MYHSINVHTGEAISDLEHFKQSAADVVTTPLISRVMRRHYGSAVFDLIDAPDSPSRRVRLMAAHAAGLMQWEPRLQLTRVQILSGNTPGQLRTAIDGTVTIGNQTHELTGFALN